MDGALRRSILTINNQNWKNLTATVKATTPLRPSNIPQGRTNIVIEKYDLLFLPRASLKIAFKGHFATSQANVWSFRHLT